MARIRTIKPEFPQSETVGRLSRNARLLFVLLWTIVDDEGRARAASRMLASLLYPYDDDAPTHIDDWLDELEEKVCIRRYDVDGSTYLDIPNWLKHQKIDKPSKSRLPEFREASSKPREHSRSLAPDLGPRTRDQDLGSDDGGGGRAREPSDVPGKKDLLSNEAISIANELAKIAGHSLEFLPPSFCGAAMRVQQWLNHGWTREPILEASRGAMQRKTDGPPVSVNYFEKPIARFIAQQSAPIPTVEASHAKTSQNRPVAGWQQSRDNFRSALAELKAHNAAERQRASDDGEGDDREIVQLAAPDRRG